MTEWNQTPEQPAPPPADPMCPKCNGHGGTYDICPRTGEIFGQPCECTETELDRLNGGLYDKGR